MHTKLPSPLFRAGLFLAIFILAFSFKKNPNNPPAGKTGAPFDQKCNQAGCHANSTAFAGSVTIDGLPAEIQPSITYALTVTGTASTGSPSVGGFQIVAFQSGNESQAGSFAAGPGVNLGSLAGRTYPRQSSPQAFSGGQVSWTMNWTAPASINGTSVHFYSTVMLCNGNGNNSGDHEEFGIQIVPFAAGTPAVTVAMSGSNVTCFGGSDGTATATPSGGNGNFTYAWSNGQTSQTATGLAQGTYSVTVSSGTSSATGSKTITQPTVLNLAASTGGGSITCQNPSVQATATASGGTAGYSYAWSSGATGGTVTLTAPGLYMVTATDAANCQKTTSLTVSGNVTPPTAQATGGALTCAVQSVQLSATTNAGLAATFSWTGPTGFTSNIQNPIVSTAGGYTVIVTNTTNGCTNSATASVSQNTTPPTATATGGTLTCAVASVVLTASTNAVNPIFSWTGPGGFSSNAQNPTVATAGFYVLTVTNPATGCTNSAGATVTENTTAPTAQATGGTLTCAVASVVLTASTNALNPVFSWTGPNGFSSNLQNPTVSAVGSYVLTVTAPANGCSATATATVSANATAPTATATGGTLTCAAASLVLQSSTNAASPAFSWTGPNGFSSSLQNPTVSTAGSYVLTVSNGQNGCTSTATATVAQDATAPTATATGGTLTCAASSVQLFGSTNAAAATFSWSGPGGFSSNSQNPTVATAGAYSLLIMNSANGCTATTTATVSENTVAPVASIAPPAVLNCSATTTQLNATASSQGASFSYAWTASGGGNIQSGATTLTPTVSAAGNYSLLISNSANGCTASASVQVSQLSAVSALVSSQNVACFGGSTGSAIASAAGGTGGGYAFSWSNGASTASIAGLAAGVYTVTASDPAGGGCSATASATIGQPALLAAGATATGETSNGANNGTATAQPTGGTPNFSFLWSTGATTAAISGLAPAAYSVTVTDEKGCTASQTVTVNSFACAVSASTTVKNVSCNGAANGTATAVLAGGALPIAFLWSTGATTATITGLAPGAFSVQMTDANGCPATASASVSQPAVLAANASATNVTSNGAADGTATAQPTGGTSPFQFLWSNGATTAAISGLGPAAYTVLVTDAHGCSVEQTVAVNAFNCAFSVAVAAAGVSCFGGSDGVATASAAGGTAPFQFMWSSGATSQTIDGLAAGFFTVSVTDAAGCFSVETVEIDQPSALAATILSQTNVVCPNDLSGSATVAASGGTAGYLFLWSNGQGGPTATGLGAGLFSVTATDANGCKKAVSGSIAAVDKVPPQVICPSDLSVCAGAAVIFSPVSATDNCSAAVAIVQVQGLPSGSVYPAGQTLNAFSATDAAGNVTICSFSVTAASATISLSATVKNDLDGSGSGSIDLATAGGAGVFSYQWSGTGGFSSTSEDIYGLFAGTYTVTATDENGCSTTAFFGVQNTTATSAAGEAQAVSIFPNPAGEELFFKAETAKALRGEVLDAAGQRVKRLSKAELASGRVGLERLAAGHYFLKLEFEKGSARGFAFEKRD